MRNVRDYAIITGTYWAFTLSDGALRMLVLLYLHQRGISPLSLAAVFVLYELFGMVTNLFGGWVGSSKGLKMTLGTGMALQTLSCALLALSTNWLTVPLVMVILGMSGIAKDFTKMSAKSYIKMVVPKNDQQGLLKWVALLTGSKNTLKGVGFFLGGFLLTLWGFETTCLAMALVLALTGVSSMLALPKATGKASSTISLRNLVPQDPRLHWLSVARLFLFASRDAWFVVALPLFLSSTLGWAFEDVGAFLAAWVIFYGFIQAWAPKLMRASQDNSPTHSGQLGWWTLSLLLPLGAIAAGFYKGASPEDVLVTGLIVFAGLFAINSALHSYLVVAYAKRDTVAMEVGFYYMSNAAGRLLGTILSGALFQWAHKGSSGLVACILASMVLSLGASVVCVPLRRAELKSSDAEAASTP